MNTYDLLSKMESAEESFLNTEFLAPVLPGGRVRVRIAGLVCTLRVTGEPEPGWAILKPLSLHRARIAGRPSLRQVRDYLALFPAVRLVLVARAGLYGRGLASAPTWLALPAHRGDTRFQREALAAETPAEDLHKPTLTAEEREAYRLAYQAIETARRDRIEMRLADALAHAGAELASYIEREDAYTVTFTVDSQLHRSTVRKDDLTVLVAGICLAGEDRRFDLQSLVGVIREAAGGRRLFRMDDIEALDEETYSQVHPASNEDFG